MIGRAPVTIAVGVFAVLHLAAVLAPALALATAARKGGLPGLHGLDLIIASGIIGSVHAVVVHRRLRSAVRAGTDLVSACIAAFDALVVVALGATGLLIIVLGGFATQHATLINRGWPVLLLWIGVQVVAVGLAELTGARVLRWLTASQPPPTQTP